MGVAGSGKTTVGRGLADALHWPYHEADDFHSAANKAKMATGTPLDDSDRAPWLASLRAEIDACRAAGRSAVFTCSALKDQYRRVLMDGAPEVTLVYLSGDPATISARVAQRSGHYLKAGLVESQFAALEPPQGTLTFDTRAHRPPEIIAAIRRQLGV